ncbi:TlpA family protein disulfide reductase [Portibacter lacus]|nr:TlpA disulfide reductase family protein [Portibacter lacus]
MKNILLLIFLVILCNCKEEHEKEMSTDILIPEVETIDRRNEVVISVNDTVNSFFTNLFLDEMQDKPDMLYLGKKVDKMSVVIPTEQSISIRGGNPWESFSYQLNLEKGDSLLIDIQKIKINPTKEINYPIFSISNSDRTWDELNFGYLLYKKNIAEKAIVIDAAGDFRKNKYEAEEVVLNSLHLLDSLKSNHLISSTFHKSTELNQKLTYETSKIRAAKLENKEIIIEDLDLDLNDINLLGNSLYISYLRGLILYKYFNTQRTVLNSTQFDFVNEQETFLNHETKLALLDSYLKSIYFVEKSKLKVYHKKFDEMNTNEALGNKWRSLLNKEKINSEKMNRSNRNEGVLTNLVSDNEYTFEEILSKQKGKVVLVDFWASWCAPCRKEMPFLEDLKSKFNSTEFKVIEISIDKNYSAWERASELENLSKDESNYFISNWEKSNLYKVYEIETIPRYLLFDKQGVIIDDDAPRPSGNELVELIKANL